MKNLKAFYDYKLASEAVVQAVAGEIYEHLKLNTPEGNQAALKLKPELRAAQSRMKDANNLYLRILNEDFKTSPSSNNGPTNLAMKRNKYLTMSRDDRLKFLKAGGEILDLTWEDRQHGKG